MGDVDRIKREISQLAFEKAVVDELTEQYKAHDRAVKRAFLEATEGMDGASFNSDAFGEAACMSKVKGREPEETMFYSLDDEQAVIDWMDEQRPDTEGFAAANLREFCIWHFETTGETAPGFYARKAATPPKPPSARMNVKRDEVFAEMRKRGFALDATMPSLLEGGEGGDQVQGA